MIDLDALRKLQTIPGDYSVLQRAVAANAAFHPTDIYDGRYEETPGVKILCDWWNANAPETAREAGAFYAYILRSECFDYEWLKYVNGPSDFNWAECDDFYKSFSAVTEGFIATCPLEEIPTFAIFARPGWPTVLLAFLRGRKFNRIHPDFEGVTIGYFANGEVAFDVNLDINDNQVDVAYHSTEVLTELETLLSICL
ncbi:hypothetical protein [Thiomonas intermedia]|uniref:hypothetical protein n=1 Tax=Thiomonas intermedia TaxID=926 RepID=UPI0009A4E234|nr:hypothetical protein [Thiomonas intermedia]